MESELLQKITDLEGQVNGLWALFIGLLICILIYIASNVYDEYIKAKTAIEKKHKNEIMKSINEINNKIDSINQDSNNIK